jgi:dipeptidyl aminopeptidase/acylaminoacyl peptidase
VLDATPGVHEAELSPSGRFLLDTHHDVDRPPVTVIRAARSGRVVAEVQRASRRGELAALPLPERIAGRAADGKTAVHGVLFKPFGFDRSRRYPVVERIYGGMQLNAAPAGFPTLSGDDYDLMLLYLAQRGFVVVMLDAPGTLGRGREYSLARHGRWPDGIIADHAAALRDVAAARPWMDLSRVGLDGNSFGGMLAIRGGLEAPSLYRAIAASVPQTDLFDSIAWMEFQLGTVDSNRAAYERGALAPRMRDLSTPLLLIAGTSDVNVSFSNVTTLVDALAEAGKRYQLVLFPGTNHTHDGRGDRYAYAIAEIAAFFERELGSAR